jgi:hypothetical protein
MCAHKFIMLKTWHLFCKMVKPQPLMVNNFASVMSPSYLCLHSLLLFKLIGLTIFFMNNLKE